MAKKLWCVLLTAVMLLNLLPVGMADNEGLEEPLTATVEIEPEAVEEAQTEAAEELLPPVVEPQTEAAEEPQPEEEAAEEPEEEAAEELLPDEADGTLDILTIPEEEQPDDERPDMLMAAAKPEDEEIVEEEDGEEEEPIPLTEVELAALGININEKVYEITPGRRCISAGTWTIKKNVNNWRRAYIDGDVTIILPDNLTLTFDFGLQMRSAKTLTITTPENSQHNGRLVAHGYEKRPGIGGWNKSLGTGFLTINSGIIIADGGVDGAGLDPEVLTVNGGTVEAKGSPNCAGIGGNNGNFGVHRIIINNGHVTARGGVNAAGIGGGNGWGGCTVIINGGVVEAYGGANAAGIGGGKGANAFYNPYYDSLTITGGTVTATGGTNGAGIGGGDGGQCGDAKYLNTGVKIAGGTVTANGGQGAAGIGGGRGGRNGSIAITGGTVTANGGQGAAGIGGGDGGNGGTVNISSGEVTATGGANAAGIGGGNDGSAGVVTISGGTVKATSGEFGAGIGTGRNGKGGIVTIRGGTVTATGGQFGAGIGGGRRGRCDSVLIEGGDVTAVSDEKGMAISGDNVTINNGTVRAQGGWNGPAIGRGKVTINGGNVIANSDSGGAGIGGENVTINGGTVTANGGSYGAGIGGGDGGSAGVVTINGGIVKATGGSYAAGIGGGDGGHGGNITITGGQVRAYGGDGGPFHGGGAGIGGGNRGSGGNLTITGGDVEAVGRLDAPGIGRGHDGRETGTLRVSPELEVFNASAGNRRIADPTAQKLDSVRSVRIGKLVLDPRVGSPTYNGRQQSGYLNPEVHVHIEGTTSAKDVGNYAFTVTPEPGYTWFDCTNAPRTFNWSIGQAKATVRANDLTITYGDKEPELTATVRGTVNGDRLNYQIFRQPGTNAGRYEITPSGEKEQGNYDVVYQPGTLIILPKDVSAIQRAEFQEIPYGSGEFTEPTFRDSALDEDISGTLTYTYNRRRMTKEELENTLAGLPAGASGTIVWNFEANGNFAGTITGRIDFRISRLEFTVDGAPATAANAVTIKNNPTYGDTWEELVTISDRIVASVNGETGSGTYTLNVSGTPNAGRQAYSVLFTGLVGRLTYTDVTVLTGEVDVAKADYKDVTKTASGELEPEAGRSVIITLPEIPQGTSYGTPRKAVESDPYTLFGISGNQIAVALTDIPETNPMTFTVPVNPDGNHNGYDITVTLTVRSGAHTHFFRYTASGHQITAVCRAANCPLPPEGVRLTLNAPANLTYDGNAKEVTFASGEAEAWKAATGSNAPTITYTADRGSVLTGGKPVNAGSYTASIRVYGQSARVRFTIAKAEYTDVTKEASGELKAANNSKVTITLPSLPRGARYGTPVKARGADRITLSPVSANRVTVTSTGIPQDVNTLSFTVPVIPDGNHNGYTVTVTVNVIQTKVRVSVRESVSYVTVMPFVRVPVYTATITADSLDAGMQDLQVEYSTNNRIYTRGRQIRSPLLRISRFFIRVTDAGGTRYVFEYRNGNIYER